MYFGLLTHVWYRSLEDPTRLIVRLVTKTVDGFRLVGKDVQPLI